MSARPTTAPDSIPAWVDGRLVPMDKIEVHRKGLRHPAVSVFLMDGARSLLQQRALGKYHSGGLWANACCTHPHWGESSAECAARRIAEELGAAHLPLRHIGTQEYRADVGGGMTEHEVVEIFVGEIGSAPLRPDPAEVMATAWVSLPELDAQIAANPADFTPWLRIYLAEGWGAKLGVK